MGLLLRTVPLLLFCNLSLVQGFDIDAHKITSLMAASYTPMKPGGLELDLSVVPKYAKYLQARNITNVMPCGSNGESLSLSVAERKSLAEALAKVGPEHG